MARRRKSDDEETSYWLSYSDMMAALLLVFVLIISFTMLQAKRQYEDKQQELEIQRQAAKKAEELIEEQKKQMELQQEQIDKIIGVRSELVEALKGEFDGTDLKVSVDEKTGAITFDSSVLFDSGKYEIKKAGQDFLEEFLPRYFSVLLNPNYKQYISEIIIEGHTDTSASYMYNLKLSQERALSVASFCLKENNTIVSNEEIEKMREIVTANGRSFSDPIYNDDGTVNMDASRRVEFKFRLKEDEMVNEMAEILK